MKIETKYNIGDKVWALSKDKPYLGTITHLYVDVDVKGTMTAIYSLYIIKSGGNFYIKNAEEYIHKEKDCLYKSTLNHVIEKIEKDFYEIENDS